jgi:hypothetical protein
MAGMSLYDVLAEEHESTLQVGRASVKLRTIDYELISPATWETISSMEDVNFSDPNIQQIVDVMLKLAQVVTDVVTSWQFVDPEGNIGPLLGKNGQPVALVVEEVATLPAKFLNMVIEHVTTGANASGEAMPGSKMNEASDEPSSGQAIPSSRPPATSQSGIRGSKPQNISAYRRGNFSRAQNQNRNGGRKRQSLR